ncbi:hypothetical protein VE02_09080 [Pseudogymnoascus sp. 03VT05]|nr:hypothetical protein VE02_09080 [Pseudogymnoascus sp. 03VT05]
MALENKAENEQAMTIENISPQHLESQLTATPANVELLAEELALEATHYVDAVGWKFLIEPYTFGSLAAMSFGLFCAAWGFAPPASVLIWINADIGIESHLPVMILMGLATGAQRCYAFLAGELMPNKHKMLGPIGHPKWTLIISNIWMTAFIGALAHCNPNNKTFAIVCSFLAALPIGFIEQQTGAIAQLVVGDREIGTSFGTMAKIPVELEAHILPAALNAGLPASSIADLFAAIFASSETAMAAVPGINADIIKAVGRAQLDEYAAAYCYVYYATIPFGVLATASAVALRPVAHLLTSNVPKMVENPQAHHGNRDLEKTMD